MKQKTMRLWNNTVGKATIVPRSAWQMQQRKPTFKCECGHSLLGDRAPQGVFSHGLIFFEIPCKACNTAKVYFLEGWDGGAIPHDII